MNTVKAESDVPIPNLHGPGSRSKYPWLMAVGESFFVDNQTIERFSSQAVHAAKRFGTKYTCRTEGKGVRIWRTK